MEPNFTNKYTLNDKLIKEYVYKILCKKIIITGIILTILSLLLFVILKKDYMIVISLISLITTLLTPQLTIKQIKETSKKLNNEKIEATTITFANNIVMTEGKNHFEFEYTQIKNIIQTKNLIALTLTKQTAILLTKEGFQNNNTKNFLEFINNKIGEK